MAHICMKQTISLPFQLARGVVLGLSLCTATTLLAHENTSAIQGSATPQQATTSAQKALPTITVKSESERTNTVKPHSTFNAQGERCIEKMLPFSGASFQR